MKFLYVNAGWEGSTADSHYYIALYVKDFMCLKVILLFYFSYINCIHNNFILYFAGKFYLVDVGYWNTNQFIVPYCGAQYYLKESGPNHASLQNHKRLFNLCHASLRNVIQRTFGVWKERFCIFQSPLQYPKVIQSNIIIAACFYHKFITEHKGGKDHLWQENESRQSAKIDEVEQIRHERIRHE